MPTPAAHVLSLRANFSWTFAGNVVYSGCQWAMLTALAKLGSREMVGQFTLGLAVTAPVILLTNMQLRSLQATDAMREYTFGHYLGLRLLTTPLALLIIAGIIIASGYSGEVALVIASVGAAKAFESISDVFYGLLQQHERMDRIALSMITKGALSLAAMAGGVYITHSALWGTLGLAVSWALVLVCYDIRNGARILAQDARAADVTSSPLGRWQGLRPLWDAHRLMTLVWLALPLGLVLMLMSLTDNVPRYAIERYLGLGGLGIYGALVYVLVAGTTLINALVQATSPRLARHYAVGDVRAFRALLLKLIGVSVLLGAVGLLVAFVAGRQILGWLYRPEYAKHVDVFLWLLVAAEFDYLASVLGSGLTVARYLRVQVPISITAVVVAVTMATLLVPMHGLIGAAWALCAAYAVKTTLNGATMVYVLGPRARPPMKERM